MAFYSNGEILARNWARDSQYSELVTISRADDSLGEDEFVFFVFARNDGKRMEKMRKALRLGNPKHAANPDTIKGFIHEIERMLILKEV
ncbi:MAG: hypothetical protein AAF850_03715 [Pseudomonadota bacterium]